MGTEFPGNLPPDGAQRRPAADRRATIPYAPLVAWNDFDDASALERDMLERALPLVPTASDSTCDGMTIDMDTGRMVAGVGLQVVIGATPETCIDLLRIRPLLVGAAWKVIDLLFEEVLAQRGLAPDSRRGWTITGKLKEARKHGVGPSVMDSTTWPVLLDTYIAGEDIRHSLVHRKAYVDTTNALVGTNAAGNPLRPLTAHEQESLVRAATTAASVVTSRALDPRLNSALLYQLSQLTGLHGHSIAASNWSRPPAAVTLPLSADPSQPGIYPLDVPKLRAHHGLMSALHADLIVQFRDRPGQELRGWLEDAPNVVELIDPDRPPIWLA